MYKIDFPKIKKRFLSFSSILMYSRKLRKENKFDLGYFKDGF